MKNITNYILPAVFFSLMGVVSAAEPLVAEGFMLDGATGVIRKVEGVDVWKFIPQTEIIVAEKTWPAEKPLNLLPCSVLEQIVGLAGEDNEIQVRLWGLFTEYQENNYLYSVYFLPLGETVQSEPAESTESAESTQTAQDAEAETTEQAAAEEEPIIPTDILEQIRTNKAPDLEKFQQVAVVTGDVNLIGRTGYLEQKNNVRYFQPNTFGQNVNRRQYLMLPCSTFEAAEKHMRKTPGRQRYQVSGLVTTYKGRNYILLRRAVRTYTNGNFTQ